MVMVRIMNLLSDFHELLQLPMAALFLQGMGSHQGQGACHPEIIMWFWKAAPKEAFLILPGYFTLCLARGEVGGERQKVCSDHTSLDWAQQAAQASHGGSGRAKKKPHQCVLLYREID